MTHPAPPPPDLDDRVVLPLGRTRRAAARLCYTLCHGPWGELPTEHHDDCLLAILTARDELGGHTEQLQQVSPDCHDPFKHPSCTGCACTCHLPSARTR